MAWLSSVGLMAEPDHSQRLNPMIKARDTNRFV